MADVKTEVNPYEQKKFFELNNQAGFNNLADFAANRNRSLADVARYGSKEKGFNRAASEYANDLTQLGYGNMTAQDFVNAVRDHPEFVAQNPKIGNAYSYADLAKQALATDPNFDPNDTATINALSEQIQKRGFTNQNKEDIRSLAVNQSVQKQIDSAMHPEKQLTDEQKTGNLNTANRLLQQNYGADYNDPDLSSFLAQRLAEGESAFELSQFLQTTPHYMQKQADVQNQKIQDEAKSAREALNQQLLQSEEEAFSRATPNIISSYMKAGRLNSSGLQNALAQARADLERERQGFLANAGYQDAASSRGYQREDFLNSQNQAFNQYLRQNEPAYQQRFAVQGYGNQNKFEQPYSSLNRYYGLQDEARQRQYQIDDYNRMKNDYFNYLNGQKPNRLLGGLQGALGGATAGSSFGHIGSGVGALLGGLGGYSAYR